MLVSPKWATMWMESQHSSKTTSKVSVPSQRAKKLLEDLRSSCFSPNKAVQLEALKCWEVWIHNQNQDDWKLNTMCYTAVRPLLVKKFQPLHKDMEICKLRFRMLWALLRKAENIMHLEGAQYILEVFLQMCLNWLSSCAEEGGGEISELIFQLLLGMFSKEETTAEDSFHPLSTDILNNTKVFNQHVDKFLTVFVHWKKVQKRGIVLKLWNHFLERWSASGEQIPLPFWHRLFRLVNQMCSEKSEPVRDRLGILHGCATRLRPALSSSKFLDFGNLLMSPCEALLKKLVQLGCEDCEEGEMFVEGMEISKVLSVESVALGGYSLCINVLNVLDEFCLRSLYWGVWCGFVHCYECLLSNVDQILLTKTEMNFYRKLRGIAVNFELDKNYLKYEYIIEVERFIGVLKISWIYEKKRGLDPPLGQLVPKTSPLPLGNFSWKKTKRGKRIVKVNFDAVRKMLKTVDVSCLKWLLNGSFRFISLRVCDPNSEPKNISISLKPNKKKAIVRGLKAENAEKRAITFPETTEKEKSTPKTRSRRRAEEEEKKKELENQKRKTRKSFEIRVQEIVQKNKERKTEKNCRKSPTTATKEKRKKKQEVIQEKTKKQNKSPKLENYFKVITKKREKKEAVKGKKRKEEVNWKQTSLITMMKGKEGVKSRNKEEGKVKVKVGEGSPLSKLSPYKEVFHDHEYAKMDLKALERVIVNKEEVEKKTGVDEKKKVPETNEAVRKPKRRKARDGVRKSKRLSEITPEEKEEAVVENPPKVPETPKEGSEISKTEEEAKVESPHKHVENEPVEVLKTPQKEEEDGEVETINEEEENEADATPKRGKKRFRILDSLKPSKKLHLEDPEEKLETEKENLKEASPIKEEKSLKTSPKMISSRALRMIALVPESTRGQMHWETSPRVEVKKKGPNVDKNSRASKMLALLSENIVRGVVEKEEINVEEMKRSEDIATTPNRKTPTSSLKSPKTVKQRRSIRFDDTKNEMVVYETDTPPSQVLEGKEIRRRIKLLEVNSPNHSIV